MALVGALAATSAFAQDLIVPSGTSMTYDTSAGGPLVLGRFEIEENATLVVTGARPFTVVAADVRIDGTLQASGVDSPGVLTLNTTNVPELGASGVAGGGSGGVGSPAVAQSSPAGGPGWSAYDLAAGVSNGGGGGGESTFNPMSSMSGARRGAGGGGGALAADRPAVPGAPFAPENIGLIAHGGMDGSPLGFGAQSGTPVAQGGASGTPLFSDGDPTNDFWGRMLVGGTVRVGEVRRPEPGRGGGAGGDAINSTVFPPTPFTASGDEKGAGGGGGGGLVAIAARRVVIGSTGQILANGGAGGGGENTIFFDRIGGGSGGGSGGWIILDALEIDLSEAGSESIQAIGGRGGVGRHNVFDQEGAGGNGGPGVIQLHTPSGGMGEIVLGSGASLSDIATPGPYVLLPALRP